MIIDTNVIVRFIVKDNPDQFEKAKDFFRKVEAGEVEARVSILVLDETIWVLQNYYHLKKEEFLPNLIDLLLYPELEVIETKKSVIVDILWAMKETTIDFTDYYLATLAPKGQVFSFDEDFKKIQFKLPAKG